MASYRNIDDANLANPAEVLTLAGLTPISVKKIAAYKAKQLEKHSGNFWLKLADRLGVDPKGSSHKARMRCIEVVDCAKQALFTFASMAVCFAVLWRIGTFLPVSKQTVSLFFDLGGASLVIVVICGGVLWVAQGARVVYPGVWTDVPYYADSCAPGWVHDIARQAQAIYPSATFVVSELREEVTWGLLDPILSTEVDGQQIALAIWDERGERVDL